MDAITASDLWWQDGFIIGFIAGVACATIFFAGVIKAVVQGRWVKRES